MHLNTTSGRRMAPAYVILMAPGELPLWQILSTAQRLRQSSDRSCEAHGKCNVASVGMSVDVEEAHSLKEGQHDNATASRRCCSPHVH
jgi:hypothetical protein